MVIPSPTQLAPLRDTLATLDRCVSPMCRQERTKNSPRAGPPTMDEGAVVEWRLPRGAGGLSGNGGEGGRRRGARKRLLWLAA